MRQEIYNIHLLTLHKSNILLSSEVIMLLCNNAQNFAVASILESGYPSFKLSSVYIFF